MRVVDRVYMAKACLCANPYLPVFFVLLTGNGLTRGEIISAIAFGSFAMILGDLVSSALCDWLGPKRVVITAAIVQATVIGLLPVCATAIQLYALEFVIGLSFPAIHGADSKWLKHLLAGAYSERCNQAIAWASQLGSAIIGGCLIRWPIVACGVSVLAYTVGLLICIWLPDVRPPARKLAKSDDSFRHAAHQMFIPLLRFSILLGLCNSAFWILQAHADKTFASLPVMFVMIQVVGAALSLTGSLASGVLLRGHRSTVAVGMIAATYVVCAVAQVEIAIWLSIGAALFVRGGVSVLAREAVLADIPPNGPVATIATALAVKAKLVQGASLALISRF